jgi:hypothetical protein
LGPMRVGEGRLPRVSRLMALAIRCERLIQAKTIKDYSEVAMLGHVSKPRVTQIMNLLHLAPGIQEQLLFLPASHSPRDWISERSLRCVSAAVDWKEQRRLFQKLLSH